MKLIVEGFSCIKHAELILRPYTVIIGEQGSGKSLLLKLNYFMVEQVLSLPRVLMFSDEEYALSMLQQEFYSRFPTGAWGGNPFLISLFSDSERLITIARKSDKGDALEVTLGNGFLQRLRDMVGKFQALGEFFGDSPDKERNLSYSSRALLNASANLKLIHKDFLVRNQFYIPSGRAFFGSLSKIPSYVESSAGFDYITSVFAQVYLSSMERLREAERYKKKSKLMERIIGGHFFHIDGVDLIATDDGRRVGLSILSSGQQELFPLIVTLDSEFSPKFPRGRIGGPIARLLYVEEPEAHLFPEAQGHVIEDLVSRGSALEDKLHLLISTHSPYVLTKINNLLFAGELGVKSDELRLDVSKVVSEKYWINRSELSAYKIDNGTLVSIFDEESGLIDGQYLDGFSSKLSHEFYELMDLEGRHS